MKRQRERGIVLLLSLLVLTILILLVGQMVISGAHNRAIARNTTGALQNEYGVLAGYYQGVARIQGDQDRNPDAESLDDVWNPGYAFALGSARVSGKIIDAERCFNLSALVDDKGEIIPEAKEQLVRLIASLGHDGENAERIADYIDADTKGAYEAGARNARPLGLQELQRIEGLKRQVLFGDAQHRGLLPYLTVWPKEGGLKINPNTAPPEVFRSLDEELTEDMAGALVEWRSGEGEDGKRNMFKSIEDVKKVTQIPEEIVTRIADRLVYKARAFEIRVHSSTFGVDRKELYVVGWKSAAGGNNGAPGDPPPVEGQPEEAPAAAELELLGSMREHEFFDMKPEDDE
jgi:general secretion pathway protein K